MLTPKEKKALERVEKNLAMPRWKFTLVYGMSFGLLLALISTITDVMVEKYTIQELFRKRLWVNLAMAPIAGVLFGIILRWLNVKQYLKLKRKESAV